MSGKTKIFGAILALSMLFLAGAAQATTRVKGSLYSVNSAANSVTLKSAGVLVTINLAPQTKFVRNAERTTLNGMVLGDKVTAVYKASLYPAKLKASGPVVSTIQGKAGAITPSGMIQIGGVNVATSAQTRIVRNGGVSSLDSITSDDDVVAHMEDNGGHGADDIIAEGPDEAEVYGTILSVDTVAGTVTFDDGTGVAVTVFVDAGTYIEAGDTIATINDLVAGMLVEVKYDPVTMVAYRIEGEDEGEDEKIEGIVTAVDAVNGFVTIQDPLTGSSVTVVAVAGTRIERDDQPAFLSDIVVGDQGKAEYDAETFIAEEIESESPEYNDDSMPHQ